MSQKEGENLNQSVHVKSIELAKTTNMDNSKPPIGVYKNPRLMHACTTIVGSTVHLQTKDGSVWEGIFNTFSPEFTICLDLAIQIDPKLNSRDCLYAALKGGNQAKKQAFFDLKDIVRITGLDVDLNYATKDMAKLTTDADISGYDANKSTLGEQRELESWQDDDGDTANPDSLLSLDETKCDGQNNGRGWDAHEMFRYNERVHKVTTTYDEKLTDYTVPLPKNTNSKDWSKKQERAAAIAKVIEGDSKSKNRLAKEDEGDCEEEKYSAVLRPVGGQQQQQQQPQQHQQPPPSQQSHQPQQQSQQQKNFRPRTYNNRERSRIDSLKTFGQKLSLAPRQGPPPITNQIQNTPSPQHHKQQQQQQQHHHQNPQHQQHHHHHHHHQTQQSSQQYHSPPQQQQHHQQQSPQQHQPQQSQKQPQNQQQPQLQQQPHQQPQSQQQQQQQPQLHPQTQATTQQQQSTTTQAQPAQTQVNVTAASPAVTSASPAADTSTLSERSDTSTSSINQARDHQSELARKSTLNPHAKEFVYKPRSPVISPQTPHYQQVPMFPPSPFPHQQQHHAAQFINYAMSPHFAQQQRYIRSNFHHHVRPDYSQQFVASPTSAPYPMNAYAGSPQQHMIYGPPQSIYPMVQAGFPQHMPPHVMPNPPAYDGGTVYMPSQPNYIVNP